MKKFNRFSLTLLSAVVLTACSGGGGSSTSSISNTMIHSTQENTNTSQQSETQSEPKKEEISEPKQTETNSQTENSVEQQETNTQPVPPKETESEPQPPLSAYNEQAVFKQLTESYGEFGAMSKLSLKLEGREIEILPTADNISFTNKALHTLRDSDDKLLGYYGYAALSEEKTQPYSDEKKAEYHYFLLHNINAEKVLPQQTMEYIGNMYYTYTEKPVEALRADVTANYSASTKQLGLTIEGENGDYWELKDSSGRKNLVLNDGQIFGKLVGTGATGQFDGGFYGKNAQIILGEAKAEDSTNKHNNWKGIVGMEAKKAP